MPFWLISWGLKAFFSKNMIIGLLRFLASPAGTITMIIVAFFVGGWYYARKTEARYKAIIAESQARARQIDQKIDAVATGRHEQDLADLKRLSEAQKRSLDAYAKSLPTDAYTGTPADDDFLNGVLPSRPVQQPRTQPPGDRKDLPDNRRAPAR